MASSKKNETTTPSVTEYEQFKIIHDNQKFLSQNWYSKVAHDTAHFKLTSRNNVVH